MVWYAKYIAQHLRKPSSGLWGYFVDKYLLRTNTQLEEATFEKLLAKNSENVLELCFGYGSGGISYALHKTMRSGTGKLFGVDYSVTACSSVENLFKSEVENGKLRIFKADVAKMPIDDEQIDKVFHTNCYYFWPDKKAAVTEIKRVMKPGGLMVTGIDLGKVEMAASKGFLPYSQWKTEAYMNALKDAGFEDIRKETAFVQSCGTDITFMYAIKP